MGFAQDAKAQWEKLPKGGKIAIGGGVLLLLFIMVYKHQSGGGTSTSASGMTAGSLPATNETSSQAPAGAFPGVQSGGNNVPYLPSGINPVYDAQGGLVAFQQAGAGNPSASGSVSPPPSSGPPASNPLAYLGLLGANAKVNFQNRTYVDSTGKSVPIPIGANDKLVQGSDNRVWYTNSGGQHLLTSGSGPAINPTTNTPFAGGGGESLQSYARGLREYHVSYGDNLHTVASQLRIKGGLAAWLAHNGNPTNFFHGMTLKVPS
jgi:hypothetical protein